MSPAIQLTDEERLARAEKLAQLIREREVLADEHQARRAHMKRVADALDRKIRALAEVVRSGVEDAQVDIFGESVP